jgi:hypothetical protein
MTGNDFMPLPASVEKLRKLAERVQALEQRLRELEIRQEQDDDHARERMEREE